MRYTFIAYPHYKLVYLYMFMFCSCQPMRAACKEGAVGSRVALEREESMRWFDHDRYLALVDNLAGAGNPEACFVLGLTLVFAQRQMGPAGTEWLRRAAAGGHKVAAYVLGVLHYSYRNDNEAKRYIGQVEGEDIVHGCKQQASGRTNRECVRCREQAVHVVREVTWKVHGMMSSVPVPVPVPPPEESCKGSGCGVLEGWSGGCAVFCSDGCRIRHEYSEFFSRVSLPVA